MSGRQQRVMVQPIVREFPRQITRDRVRILTLLGRMSFSKIFNRCLSCGVEIARTRLLTHLFPFTENEGRDLVVRQHRYAH